MGYKFNPFTGNLDTINGPAGTFTDVDLSGDLTLGSGIPTTTLQAITPTADRTISFPDATGTVALVSGSNGTVQYNEGGVLKGNSDFTVDPDWNDAGVVFTGLKLNVTDTASAAGSNLLDLQVGGTSKVKVNDDGAILVGENAAVLASGGSNTLNVNLNNSFTSGASTYYRFNTSFGFELHPNCVVGWGSSNATSNFDTALARDSAGVVKVTDGSTGTGYIKQVPVAVSALPAAATVGAGTRGFVNDANATTFASVVAGGGANTVPVYSDGTNWLIG